MEERHRSIDHLARRDRPLDDGEPRRQDHDAVREALVDRERATSSDRRTIRRYAVAGDDRDDGAVWQLLEGGAQRAQIIA